MRALACSNAINRVDCIPEEDEVTLVVEGHGPAAIEIGVLAEQRGEHAADAVAKRCVEIVQDQLRLVRAGPPMSLDATSVISDMSCRGQHHTGSAKPHDGHITVPA